MPMEKLRDQDSRLIPEPEQYKKSIEKLGELDIEVILTGHGKPVTSDANKKLDEYINKLIKEGVLVLSWVFGYVRGYNTINYNILD